MTPPHLQRDPHRVLVVDDNADAAESLALMLQLDGHVTHVCTDAPCALSALLDFGPTVVLLDIGLPRLSGVDFAARMRVLPTERLPRLVALVGVDDEENERQRTAFDAYLGKPVDPALLQRALDGHAV